MRPWTRLQDWVTLLAGAYTAPSPIGRRARKARRVRGDDELLHMSADGTIPRSLQEKMIAFQRRSLKIEREVSPEQVYDFTIVRALNEKLRKEK